jgi:hypothetical protein
MKTLLTKVIAFLKTIKLRWWFVYILYAILVYVHLFGILGTIGMTVAIILLHNKIDALGK